MLKKHYRLSIDFHITIADTPPLLPEGMIEPPDPEYDARQARLLEAVKNNPEVLKRWILEEIALEIEAYSAYELASMITGGEVSLQDILAPALETLSAEDREYFDEVARLDVFEECIDMFSASFTVHEDPPVIVEQEEDFLDEIIRESTERNPEFSTPMEERRIAMSGHNPWSEISAKLRADPEIRAQIEEKERALAVRIYALGQLGSGEGARLLGLTRREFLTLLDQYNVSPFDDEIDLKKEAEITGDVTSEQDEVEVSPELAAELDSAHAEIETGEVRDCFCS